MKMSGAIGLRLILVNCRLGGALLATYALAGTASPALAQGSSSISAYFANSAIDFGDSHLTNRPILGGGFTFTWGDVDKHSGMVGSAGAQYRHYTANTADFGHASVDEIGIPFTLGYRVRQVAFGMAIDGRQFFRSSGTGAPAEPQNARVAFVGAYGSIALGRPGTIGGKFGIEGRYLWGVGSYTQLDVNQLINSGTVTQTATLSMNSPHDMRLGLRFFPSPKVLLRAEYEEMVLDVDTTFGSPDVTNPLANAQKNKNLGFTLGFVF